MTSPRPAPRLVVAGGVFLLEEDAPGAATGGPGPALATPTREVATRRHRRRARHPRPGPVAGAPDPTPPASRLDRLEQRMEERIEALLGQFDTVDRLGAELMFLILSLPDLIVGSRLEFSPRTRTTLCRVVAAPPFNGSCPCCLGTPVLTPAGERLPGAEFDHAFHPRLNRPEMGWLICSPCHAALGRGGYLARFDRMPRLRLHQAAVLRLREADRQEAARPAPHGGPAA